MADDPIDIGGSPMSTPLPRLWLWRMALIRDWRWTRYRWGARIARLASLLN